jgi:hypothetical protein
VLICRGEHAPTSMTDLKDWTSFHNASNELYLR